RGNHGKRRKAFGAMRTMTREIGDYVLVRQVMGQDRPTAGVQAYLFRGEDDNKLVIWNIDGDRSVLIDNLANAKIEVRDVQRRPVTLKYGDDGTVTLLVNREPIYVSGVSADVSPKIAPAVPRNLRMNISLS